MINKLEDIEPEELSPEDKIWLYARAELFVYCFLSANTRFNLYPLFHFLHKKVTFSAYDINLNLRKIKGEKACET